VNLSESERTDLARELDTANHYLLVSVSGDDEGALRIAMGYGVAALCRFAAEAVRPQTPVDGDDPRQLRLFPDKG